MNKLTIWTVLLLVQSAQTLLVEAVKEMLSGSPLPDGPFCVADIGSSVGNNSIRELAAIIQCLDQQVLKPIKPKRLGNGATSLKF